MGLYSAGWSFGERQEIAEIKQVPTDFKTVWGNLDVDERRQLCTCCWRD